MAVSTVLHQHLSLYGYTRIDTPIVEPASLFLTKAGDQVIERLLTFSRSGREYALRPEFTASAVERYQTAHEPIVRWQFSGAIFQDDPAHPGQFQSMSLGAELIGMKGAAADAEVLTAAALGLHAVGAADYRVIIGHVGLTRHLLKRFNLDDRTTRFLLNQKTALTAGRKAEVIEKLDAYLTPRGYRSESAFGDRDSLQAEQVVEALLNSSERGIAMGGRTREDIAQRLVTKSQRAAQRESILAAIDWLDAWVQIQTPLRDGFARLEAFCGDDSAALVLLDEFKTMLSLLEVYGIDADKVTIKPDLARTWDYYTGVVFELTSADGIDLGGGGRYDELMRLLGGQNTPAVGFAYYLDHVTQLVGNRDNNPDTPLITLSTSGDAASVAQWAQALRTRGIRVALTDAASNGANAHLSSNHTFIYRDIAYSLDQIDVLIHQLRAE